MRPGLVRKTQPMFGSLNDNRLERLLLRVPFVSLAFDRFIAKTEHPRPMPLLNRIALVALGLSMARCLILHW